MEKDIKDNDYKAMGDNYMQLINIAQQFKIPVFVISQTNREALNNNNPTEMSASADSFKKMQHADVILGLSRSKEEAQNNFVKLNIAGARRGKSGYAVPLRVNYASNLFVESSKEEYESVIGKTFDQEDNLS